MNRRPRLCSRQAQRTKKTQITTHCNSDTLFSEFYLFRPLFRIWKAATFSDTFSDTFPAVSKDVSFSDSFSDTPFSDWKDTIYTDPLFSIIFRALERCTLCSQVLRHLSRDCKGDLFPDTFWGSFSNTFSDLDLRDSNVPALEDATSHSICTRYAPNFDGIFVVCWHLAYVRAFRCLWKRVNGFQKFGLEKNIADALPFC